jgi:hypothetical protein
MKNQTRILSLLILACLVFLISCTKETIIEPDNVISTWYELHKNPNTLETVQWDKMTTLQLSNSSTAYSVPAKDSVNFKELIFFKEQGKQEAVYKVYSPLKNGLELNVYSLSGILLKNGIINRRSSKKYSSPFLEMRKDIEIGTLLDEVIVTAPKLSGSDWSAWTGFHYGGGGDYSQGYLPYFGSGGGGGLNSGPMNFSDYNYSKITNNLTNPCFIQVLQELQAGNAYGRVGEILRKYGINNSGMNFTINDNEEPESIVNIMVNGVSAEGVKKVFGSTINGVITINKSTMRHASKEFIAATILHEMLHVFIKGNSPKEHDIIIEQYSTSITKEILGVYNINPESGIYLAFTGLNSSTFYTNNINPNSQILNSVNLTIANYANFNQTNQYGTYCKN